MTDSTHLAREVEVLDLGVLLLAQPLLGMDIGREGESVDEPSGLDRVGRVWTWRTDLVEHEELGVTLVQVVFLPAHLDVHVVDGVPSGGGIWERKGNDETWVID